jgi:Zn-dependent protease with chaperone function
MKNLFLTIILIFTAAGSAAAGTIEPTAEQMDALKATYTDSKPTEQVLYWKGLMPAAAQSEVVEQVFKALPKAWLKHRASEAAEAEIVKRIEPVTKLYSRNYKIVLVEFDKPFLMVDSDAVLILSTELLKDISDDELLGLVAHEAAHSIFREKSLQLKAANQTPEVLSYLALIELSCDAIAARTMMAINRPPLAFLTFIKKIESNYSEDNSNAPSYHPTATSRIKIIKQILS